MFFHVFCHLECNARTNFMIKYIYLVVKTWYEKKILICAILKEYQKSLAIRTEWCVVAASTAIWTNCIHNFRRKIDLNLWSKLFWKQLVWLSRIFIRKLMVVYFQIGWLIDWLMDLTCVRVCVFRAEFIFLSKCMQHTMKEENESNYLTTKLHMFVFPTKN